MSRQLLRTLLVVTWLCGLQGCSHHTEQPSADANRMQVLIASLDMQGPVELFEAFRELKHDGPTAVPYIIKALHDGSSRKRLYLIHILGVIKDPSAIPALVEIADSKSDAMMTPQSYTRTNNDSLALEAMDSIYLTLNPVEQELRVGSTDANDEIIFRVVIPYYEKRSKWYSHWRKSMEGSPVTRPADVKAERK